MLGVSCVFLPLIFFTPVEIGALRRLRQGIEPGSVVITLKPLQTQVASALLSFHPSIRHPYNVTKQRLKGRLLFAYCMDYIFS